MTGPAGLLLLAAALLVFDTYSAFRGGPRK